MLTYQPVTPEQMDDFLRLLRLEMADYLDRTMELMQMTWPEFEQVGRSVGRVFAVQREDQVVGYYWIEERDRILHLHGIVILEAFRGQGIGTEILARLARQCKDTMDAIELGVQEANAGARRLYERMGYRTTKHLEDLGFFVMQCPLTETKNSS